MLSSISETAGNAVSAAGNAVSAAGSAASAAVAAPAQAAGKKTVQSLTTASEHAAATLLQAKMRGRQGVEAKAKAVADRRKDMTGLIMQPRSFSVYSSRLGSIAMGTEGAFASFQNFCRHCTPEQISKFAHRVVANSQMAGVQFYLWAMSLGSFNNSFVRMLRRNPKLVVRLIDALVQPLNSR